MISSEFSVEKLRRKIRQDGLKNAIIAAGDLLTRKQLGRPVFDPLVEGGVVKTTSREELRSLANKLVPVSTPANDDAAPFVASVGTARILSGTGMALTGDLGILEESAAEPERAQQAMMAMLSRELFYGDVPVRRLVGRHGRTGSAPALNIVAPLVPRYPNYYHWMVETVPKIQYLRAFEEATAESVTILVPDDAPPFVDETLRLLGWPQSNVVHATEPSYVVRNLVVPSYPERHASDFEWIRRDVLEAVSDGAGGGDRNNVYVSRSNAIERRVLNEEAVMSVLSEFGFSRYHLEDRSLAENARLFADADVVVGPHGAGLTDIIFAEDCTLVELFGKKVKEPYELLADTLGIGYEPMYCQADSADIVVDTKKLEMKVGPLVG